MSKLLFDTIEEVIGEIRQAPDHRIESWGHGAKSYTNLNYKLGWPRLWLYPVEAFETKLPSGALKVYYSILIDVMDIVKLGEKPEKIREVLHRMRDAEREFFLRFTNKPIIKPQNEKAEFTQKTEELIHKWDDNLVGIAASMSFTITEPIPYPC